MPKRKLSILMHGGAKRVSIARMFLEEARKSGLELDLYSWELQPVVPIAEVADIAVGRRCDDPLLLEDLHKFSLDKGIDIMIHLGRLDGGMRKVIEVQELIGKISRPLWRHFCSSRLA